MTTKRILKELKQYLKPVQVAEMELNLALKGSIVMILCLADVIRDYHSTEENERIVSHLLSQLCKNHFREIEYPKPIEP